MKFIITVMIILSLLLMFGCASKNTFKKEYLLSDGVVLENNKIMESFKFDRYQLNNVKIVGDSIIINLSYSGGCRQHEFNLIAQNYFGDTELPEVKLILAHDNKLDPCEAYLTKDHSFNLLPLKYEFFKLFGEKSGSIQLRLEDRNVNYDF